MKPEYGIEIEEVISAEEDSGHNGKVESESLDRNPSIDLKELKGLKSQKEFLKKLKKKNIPVKKISKMLSYEKELKKLQIELVKLQRSVCENHRRVVILFDGRAASGKSEAIRQFTEHLNPRAMRVVALPHPTAQEKGQWYFQRYVNQLPNRGEIVFFDRSWYNRAVIEPVNGFCSRDEYSRYMRQVPEFEHMLCEDGIDLIKLWFSVSKKEQVKRIRSRGKDPLGACKLSPVTDKAQKLWNKYTKYEDLMFRGTHTTFSPWVIVRANKRRKAHLESIRHVLSNLDYKGKKDSGISLTPDPDIIRRFHRSVVGLD